MARSFANKAKAYLKTRQTAARTSMQHLKVDGLLVASAADLAYLTGLRLDDSVGLLTEQDFLLVTDFRYWQQVQEEAGWLKLIERNGAMAPALAQAIAKSGARAIGFDVNVMTVGQHGALEAALRSSNAGARLMPLEHVLANLRKVKDDPEIAQIREAVRLSEETFDAIRGEIKPGLTENHVAGMLVAELRSRGASDASFPVMVASGPNSALPHHRPGDSLIQREGPLLIDWGASVGGYCADLTRTLLLGRLSHELRAVYDVVQAAHEAVLRFLRPGVTTSQADRVAREVIERAGYGKRCGHAIGHGIGLEIHELPQIAPNTVEEELRPGMVLAIEPGVYVPGLGGVRIEDNVLITHSGCEVLSNLDRSWEGCRVE